MAEVVPSIFSIRNNYADTIEFCIEPYGMIYIMHRNETFNIVIAGVLEDNQFELFIYINRISLYGDRETMSIYNEQGVKLEF